VSTYKFTLILQLDYGLVIDYHFSSVGKYVPNFD